MTIFIAITLAALLAKIICMIHNKIPTDIIGMFIVAIMLVSTTLNVEEALSCFSSGSVVLVGVIFILSAGLIHTGVPQWIVNHFLSKAKGLSDIMLRLLLPAAFLSAFINNLAVVQLFIAPIKMWARKRHIAPSRLLLPLSYATTLGGLCTIIGNASNIVVADFYINSSGPQVPLNIFTPLLPGLFCMAIGIISIILLQRLLPVRKSPEESFESSAEYTVELLVPTDCPHIGQTVSEAKLYSVPGGHLIEIVRFDREVISPVPADEFIIGGDRLVYSGRIDSILELRKPHGLANATHHVFNVNEISKNRKLQTASIDANSPLIGTSISETEFENDNNVVLVAIAREGERIREIPRETVLRAGDTLLFEGSKLNPKHFYNNLNFFDSVSLPQTNYKTIISSLIMILMVVLSAFKIMPLLNSCFLAAVLMCVTRCFSLQQLQRSIQWNVLMVFAGSVCLGRAIDVTGIADYLADGVMSICSTNDSPNAMLSLILICFTATLITEFVASTTAAAVLTPIAMDVAATLHANPLTFLVGLMLAVSCSFATPIGSDSNTMVYGPGGYKFGDYFKIGLCMNIIMLCANIFITNIVFPLYP